MFEGIDNQVVQDMRTAVNELFIRIGEQYSNWQLTRVEKTDCPYLYRVEVTLQDMFLVRGLAFYHNPYKVDLMLDTMSLYMMIAHRVTKQLQQYTIDNPWIMGL